MSAKGGECPADNEITACSDTEDKERQKNQSQVHDDLEGGVCLGLGSDATHPQIAVAFDFLAIIVNIPERLAGIHLLDFIHDKHGGHR